MVIEQMNSTEALKKLMRAVEAHYQGRGFNNINLCTSAFQAPGFYEKLGFRLEYIRENKTNPKLTKYFYVKFSPGEDPAGESAPRGIS